MEIKNDCRFFIGDRPCKFHKMEGMICDSCHYYEAAPERVLIIKLGAAGDVVRTTPLIDPLKKRHPRALIYWVTDYPELIPQEVDRVFTLQAREVLALQATPFQAVYNLDKDLEACALAALLPCPEKFGFTLEKGVCVPLGEAAHHKWLTGLSDPLNQANTMSYLEEIFEICGFKYQGEPYIMNPPDQEQFKTLREKPPVIGLNTGCGKRWTTRLWPLSNWIFLAEALIGKGFTVILLGGPDEHHQNLDISRQSGAIYPGHFPLMEFINLLAACDLVVTGVTLAVHLALGLQKKIVLFNNIFNRHEFEMFGLGEIIEPEVPCRGCFKGTCETNCMELISPELVLAKVEGLLQQPTF